MGTIERLPTLFIPHGGGPCFFMDPPASSPHMWDGLAAYLRGIDASLGVRPKAVLVISGHWENPIAEFAASARRSAASRSRAFSSGASPSAR
jgi:aromatic ring-opening dioxygenase catalytic subunit (LigB family)